MIISVNKGGTVSLKPLPFLSALLALAACDFEGWQWGGYTYSASDAVHTVGGRTVYVLDRYIRGADCDPVPLLCQRDAEQCELVVEWADMPLVVGDELIVALDYYGDELVVVQPDQLPYRIPLQGHGRFRFRDYDLAENAGERGVVFLLLEQYKWNPRSCVICELDPLESRFHSILILPWEADCMVVTPDGGYAYCCEYGEGTLWEVELAGGLVQEREIPGGVGAVFDVSPDGGRLLYRDSERNYGIFDLATEEVVLLELGDRDSVRRFDTDGRVILVQGCDVYSLDPSSGDTEKVIDVPTDVPDY
jgi:hypothetical protein